jgi:hypothetical protein
MTTALLAVTVEVTDLYGLATAVLPLNLDLGLGTHNQNPKIFVWSAPVERVLEKSPYVKKRWTHYTR